MPTYKDEKGQWYCKFYYTDYKGNRRQKLKRGFARQRDAKDYETEFLANASTQPDLLFPALYNRYCLDVDTSLRANTIRQRNYKVNSLIIPFFAKYRVDEITPLIVRQWQNEMIERGYSQSYLNSLHYYLSSILNHAVKFYGLRNNPCAITGAPKNPIERPKTMFIWTLDDYLRVSSTIVDIKAKTAISVLYWSGMRKGELYALTAKDIDLDTGIVTINKSYQRIRGKDVITPTKTGNARSIMLPKQCIDDIKVYYDKLYDKQARLFAWEKRFIENGIAQGARDAHVKRITVHALRHSHASLLISQGVNIVLISKRLGHDKVSTTLDIYSHFFPDDEHSMIEQINTSLSSIKLVSEQKKNP